MSNQLEKIKELIERAQQHVSAVVKKRLQTARKRKYTAANVLQCY